MDNSYKILVFLGKNISNAYTLHELSTLLKIPYATFYRTVQTMGVLLVVKVVGKAKTIQLNTENPIIKSHLTVASDEEKKEFLKDQPLLKKIERELVTKDIVLLFGSYAKKTQHEKSDIDFLIINKEGSKTISFSKYELLYKKKIHPLFITYKEFEVMLKHKEENVGKQALKNHIMFTNPEKFWECVLHAIRQKDLRATVQ